MRRIRRILVAVKDPAAKALPALRKAAQIRSDIVVMGAVARSGLRRLLIGNIAERVLDYLPWDLLVVKPSGFRRAVPRRRRGARFVSAARVPAFY